MPDARRIACSAAILAANGVLFRDPLKPDAPALALHTVFPCISVTVTMVLLNDAKMCTCAADIVRLVLRAPFLRDVLEP